MKMKKSKVSISINNLTIFSVILITSSSIYCDPIKSVHSIKSDFVNDINQVKGHVKGHQHEEPLSDEPIDVNETDVISWFEETNSNLYLNHLAINSYTGQVYVGGVNWIYQLSSQLQLETKVQMGPADDSPDCPVTRNCPNVSKKPTNYFNKVLLIDYAQSRLISCGNLFQGICSVHQLDNVSSHDTPSHESVVANNETASTVAFIAPGPQKSLKHVLYVGVTYTGNGPYRSDVPAVSSRSLDSNAMFTIASTGVTTGTRLHVNSLSRDRYPIQYVYGFQSRGFSYFLTIQKKSTDSPRPFISKLVRICQKDADYYSYTEVPIKCRLHGQSSQGQHENIDYNLAQAAFLGKPGSELATSLGITAQDDILFVAFSKSHDQFDVYNKPSNQSAVCVYALSAVHRKFTQNIQHCFNGNGYQGLDYINPSQQCVPTQVQINDDFCGLDVNTPLGGSMPVEASPVLTYKNVIITSITSTSTHDYTVVFMGTQNGHLKKAVVESSLNAFEFSDIIIDEGQRVNSDMHFVDFNNRNYLYVMTQRKVFMVSVQKCQIHQTCGDCLGARDPYCGWCSLENKCSLRSDCAEAAQDPLYWLSYKSGKCTTITQVHPAQIQRTTARTLNLVIDNLPVLDGQFLCAFTAAGKTQMTNATRSSNGVTCPTPPTDSLPSISPGQHHFTAKLSVRMKTGPDFVATNFTFYDCSSYSSCTQCVSSSFPCDWCVGGHRCTHDTGENCRNDILVTGVSSVGPSIRSGPGFCPRINATLGGATEILVPSGMTKRIQVKVDNIPQFIVSTRFVCQFNIEGRVKQVNAQLLGDTIYCEGLEFAYQTNQMNITTAFAVIWDGGKPLDNPENIHVLVYRCQNMAQNCGFCLELNEKYSCGWCQDSDSCQVNEHCQVKNQNQINWLNRQQTCPDPKILNFYPRSGPWEGGTNITIEGINLGRHYDDISNGITIAQEIGGHITTTIPCVPHRDGYVKTSKITCQIQSPRNLTAGHQIAQLGSISGPIIVRVLNDYQAKSKELFSFVNPKILSMQPSTGPASGGTKITIEGMHMDAGSRAQISLGSFECHVIRRSATSIDCVTTERPGGPGKEKLKVKIDYGSRSFDFYSYFYVEDPQILLVESGSGRTRGEVRGIPSGGMNVTVKGTNLNIIQLPQMYVEVDNEKFISNCTKLTPQEIRCETPSVPQEKLEFYEDKDYVELDYGFLMDHVKGVMGLSKKKSWPSSTPQFSKFKMFKLPQYHRFTDEDGIKYFRGEYLTINGNHLDSGLTEADIQVWIGNAICNVTSLSRLQLTCRPPADQPPAIDWLTGQLNHNELPDVIVSVGRQNFTIGKLNYGSFVSVDFSLSQSILIFIIISICILFLIVVGILIAYRRKSTESNRVLKTMRDQMDVLELKVASECKEAFAELQTHLTDITNDLSMLNSGIPFLDYRIYTLKVLFPNHQSHEDSHPVLKELQIDNPMKRANIEKGLRHFGQLIMNKTFLLLFIRTLESNRYFSMRDRVNVASLIMVTLQGKMEYCTDILKTLLGELIEKCIEGKSHPKLLLRRTESVAEKMLSSWFTFLLYKFLKECAGEPLFLMYKAIKHQIDKGPVDALTFEARYSLSEEKLIRQQIEFKMMTVYVSVSPDLPAIDSGVPCEETPIKVLDCDSIGQVKDKILDQIYKNVPFSQRPSKDDLDLEWRTGQAGRLVLSDEDQTTKIESGEWKRLNTLGHYKVSDGSSLCLIPKQNSLYNLSSIYHQQQSGHHPQHPHQFNGDKFKIYGQQIYPVQQPIYGHQIYGQQNYGQQMNGHQNYGPNYGSQQLYGHGIYDLNHYDYNQRNTLNNKIDHKYETLNFGYHSNGNNKNTSSSTTTTTAPVTSPPLSRATSPLNHNDHYENGSFKYYHLIKQHSDDNKTNGHRDVNERDNKMVAEIYLTRLLATKGTLQKFVDDLFETIFSTAHRGSTLPLAIKYMFDFLDDQSVQHGITDPEVVHTWKSNSLPLRFWVNLIKNPNFVFDIHKSNIIDSCLSVVAQTFMDACSTSEHRLGKDSPSSKLLYAKDIPIYKDWVERYYNDIRLMPSISDQDMNAMLAEESRQHAHEFNTNVSLHELYTYAIKYNDQLMQTLEEDEFSRKNKLAWKLEQVHTIITGESDA